MSEQHTDCDRFEDWLLEGGGDSSAWHLHLEECSSCRQQWASHQMLVASFAEAAVPELSPAFQAGLEHKLQTAVRVEPLRGWRLAAFAGYALAAAAFLRWIFFRFPLPSISIDPSSPWVSIAALIAVPLTFLLAIAATRLLPTRRDTGVNPLAL